GAALNCRIATFSKWDRKSYYYPDMPKNYQISQYDLPLAADGYFEIPAPDGSLRRIGIIRAHLEEDAGKNLHEGLDHTRVDLNRAGTPLLEIVTQPDISNAEEAYTFCVELQRLVRFLGISDADMQKGHMRFEPNVNVAITHDGRDYRTPISEIKNLNSFRSVRHAIEYEISRQVDAWEADHDYTLDKVGKLNFGWNDERGFTEFQRGKEESHDYRYFPDPDLVPVTTDEESVERIRADIGELPVARQRRFMADYGLSDKDCEIILVDAETAALYEAVANSGVDPKLVTRQFVGVWNNLASAVGESIVSLGMTPQAMSELAKLAEGGTISASAAAQVAQRLYQGRMSGPSSALDAAEAMGLIQVRDEGATQGWVDEAFAKNPQAVDDALSDNERKSKAAPGFLRGQVMKISQGKADPKLVGELIEKKLSALREAPPSS
ncbi:MAG TPA: Asp-tRNA(Asn)/Glu-tRNA(Gln) amidotransferase subunit GatB, partial [Phycisphaerae bacterium]|nr:Asp-tRNA(Asn)/Glu-tRNA(Gln) amidotransferase subunit GatB [Phycisphaerae bacterium]